MILKNNNSIVIIIIIAIMPNLIYGYMDPGTWSYLISFLIAFFAGSIIYIKSFWIKIKFLIKKLFTKK